MFRTPPIDIEKAKGTSEPNGENPTGYSCGQCNMEDNNEMVQCDKCDVWYHFKCADVNQSIENSDWKCIKCTGNVRDDKAVSVLSVNKTKAMSVCSGTSSRQRLFNLELQRLEEEKRLEARFIERKYEILARSEEAEGSICSDHISRTKNWVSNLQIRGQDRNSNHNSPIRSENKQNEKGAIPKSISQENTIELTKNQLSARKAFSTDLPNFSGKPEEWPLFISSYVESTKLCGYSDSENLLRLQKCLKGKALDAVSYHLLLPQNVAEVIRTLKMMFGRPEIIISSLLDKIRSETTLKSDKLDGLISYAISVRNLCSTLDASGLEAHKNNPLLLQELVDKLPN